MQANQDSTIDEAILQAAKDSVRRILAGKRSPFYPSRDDLLGIVLLKLTIARARVEEIWNNPDAANGGLAGLQRFTFVIARHALIDEKRRNEARAPEVLARSLSEPVRISGDGDNEETGTLADLISDEIDLPQAFRFEDLRSEMTDDEFRILHESIVNGASVRDLAEERSKSRSEVGRIAASAKGKARKWVEWLRHASYKQVRAHISLTFERRPCLRPDKIAPETLESWNTLRIVPFHDESSEWRPPITKQAHVRAKRECWNAACKNGQAIGRDNLVLPAARLNEAVRFLPARTSQDNRLCEGCKEPAERVSKEFDVAGICLDAQDPQHLAGRITPLVQMGRQARPVGERSALRKTLRIAENSRSVAAS